MFSFEGGAKKKQTRSRGMSALQKARKQARAKITRRMKSRVNALLQNDILGKARKQGRAKITRRMKSRMNALLKKQKGGISNNDDSTFSSIMRFFSLKDTTSREYKLNELEKTLNVVDDAMAKLEDKKNDFIEEFEILRNRRNFILMEKERLLNKGRFNLKVFDEYDDNNNNNNSAPPVPAPEVAGNLRDDDIRVSNM